ncbi:MAG: RpiB/LacA/LacB family sugar-phosphate isomerase [Candidatus Spechtbacterales bacterium]
MKIYLGSDHTGYELKEKIKIWLEEWGYEYKDMGAFGFNSKDDYPDFIKPVAESVADDPENSRGIVLGFNGQGEGITANRYKGVRACVYYGEPVDISTTGQEREDKPKNMIILSREDDDTNVLAVAAGFISDYTAEEAIKLWLETPFTGEERHKRRINKIDGSR